MSSREETTSKLADVFTHLAAAVKAARGVGVSVDALAKMLRTEWQLESRRNPTPLELARQRQRRKGS